MLIFLQIHLWMAIFMVSLLSIFVGIFLNEVIHRYPLVLKKAWLTECFHFLQKEKIKVEGMLEDWLIRIRPQAKASPCTKFVHFFYKAPLFFLKEHSLYFRGKAGIFYCVVELLTILTSLIVFWRWSFSLQTLWLLYFTWIIIVISAIDFKTQIIPDGCVFLLLWSGLLLNGWDIFATPLQAILGAILGYVSLAIFQRLFRLVRKKEGMGCGDLKLTAALLAWLGVQYLPLLLLIAAFLALIYSVVLLVFKKIQLKSMIPFGPFLSLSGWLLLSFGGPIQRLFNTILKAVTW
jgi:leader peptidase (prepilin peptidase)/N-methyltransferase